eukprot:TRINITY_DN11166_c0_g1_i2.p1 TRINITY_DN11166_c0_g1~~TRINITY_DN11166_c0_g1_i2.p1  ORF type:complete len:324 (+),score=54.08 TRINITY_DN11166_c0_g1_i2:295-1266(+)
MPISVIVKVGPESVGIEVEHSWVVGDLRREVEKKAHLSSDLYDLLWQDVVLDREEEKVSDLSLTDGEELHVRRRADGVRLDVSYGVRFEAEVANAHSAIPYHATGREWVAVSRPNANGGLLLFNEQEARIFPLEGFPDAPQFAMATYGDYLYIALGSYGVHVFLPTTDHGSFKHVGSITHDTSLHVVVKYPHLIVSSGWSAMLYKMQGPTEVIPFGMRISTPCGDISISETYFVILGRDILSIFSHAGDALATHYLPSSTISLSGTVLYASKPDGVVVYSIRKPEALERLGDIDMASVVGITTTPTHGYFVTGDSKVLVLCEG